ncbi:helix-turn-helix domain-containing protein [Streptomyces sp. NPDC102274]|uniref:helix-turn-helix domain-containing protein n=1 Tax=Streptomyces sp. NPDC102274 TaxID=3366151 RepID=UPI00380587D5
MRETASFRPTDGPRLETVLTDLFNATLAHHLDADDRVPSESRQRTLVLRVQAYAQRHLHDPDLTPRKIAEAHQVSVGHLHRLFQTQETTVADWVRRRRLEGARRDLADPAMRAVPVHRIGTRWGFTHHAAFTRAFRTAYGLPPRDYREQKTSVDEQQPRGHTEA